MSLQIIFVKTMPKKIPRPTPDQSRRKFLKNSAYAAYTAPALTSLLVSTNAAASYNAYINCMANAGFDYAKKGYNSLEEYCRDKHLK